MTSLEPWHWRSLPLHDRSGSDIFEALFQPHRVGIHAPTLPSDKGQMRSPLQNWRAIATLLESPAEASISSGGARFSICGGPPRQYRQLPAVWAPPIGQILPMLRARLASRWSRAVPDAYPAHLPFTGGWLGWLGYDLAWEIEQLPTVNRDPLPFPVAFWYEPETFAVLDHSEQQLWLAATHIAQLDDMERSLDSGSAQFSSFTPPRSKGSMSSGLSSTLMEQTSLSFVSTQADYEQAVAQAKQYIQAGDIFQTNLSLRFSTATQANSWDIYRALQQLNPSPFASYWQTPWGDVVSCSPERLVQRQGAIVQTRPIAGTRPRGTTPEDDQRLQQDLSSNIKENAEHIMLVDLERNDLGRVCEWGTVHVDELLTIEHYSHVMHLVSNVKGKLRSPYDSIDLIRAMFPGGTITGCPKVRCMEIIEELEPLRRSLFYGSCGYLDWRGDLDLNILIRTLLYVPQPASHSSTGNQSDPKKTFPRPNSGANGWAIAIGQIGAGIVADSQPAREWQESMTKAQAQLEALHYAKTVDSPTDMGYLEESPR
ncbi:MAG: anthranilate synthase component I [Elainellaceae cyanobacterium]